MLEMGAACICYSGSLRTVERLAPEYVPADVAAEIFRRPTRLSSWSMGSGGGFDAQYLFAMDILGDPTHRALSAIDHLPRHAPPYRDFDASSV